MQLETLQIRLPKAIIKRLDSDAKQDMYATSRSELIRHIIIKHYEAIDLMKGMQRDVRKSLGNP